MASRQINPQEDTNFRVLRLLQDKGLVKIHNFQTSQRKLEEYELLKAEIESLHRPSAAPDRRVKPSR